MKTALLVTKQLKLAMEINTIGNQNNLFVNNFTDPNDIDAFINNDDVVGIIWDLSVTDLDQSLSALKRLRGKFHNPIIILSTNHDIKIEEKIFHLKIDDYIIAPFQEKDIILRLKTRYDFYAELNQSQQDAGDYKHKRIEKYKDFVVDLKHFQIKYKHHNLNLTPKEFYLLYYLIRHNNQVLSRAQIFNSVWHEDRDSVYISSRIVDMHISHLRDKLNKFSNNTSKIKTIRGFGYIFQ
ncbi:DNA-binding response regulator [Philodulcilactobacillus myokoensis]|uniref:DNA-binding response regulator n=1 Tax=Philodulcilactobacillus myokoensis TaxID=2929573 RepID=A0A9W6B3T3_9LACO|nr:response regulator transcription factor [Philodulcilactobacillus myokoensis]GLB47563.1 DNA-binding response regulator [Philodulcilactobacillus myokoensis]